VTAILQQLGLDMTFFTQFAVFAVLFLFLGQVFFKPFLALLEERHRRTQRDREAAATMATETKAKLEEYESRVRSARLEARAEVEQAISEAKAEEARVLGAAREEAKKITLETIAGLSIEKERVRAQLEVDAESLATAISEKLLLKKG
jgi:F-type H+-transporting ATPase subunit b